MRRKARGQAMDFKPVLDRILDARLIALEGREMGIQDDPDYKKALDRFGDTALRTALQKELVVAVKADAAAEEGYFKATVKEFKLRTVKFFKEDEAKAFREAVVKGGSFEALATAAVAAKKAESGEPGYVAPAKLLPELVKATEPLKEGELTPLIKLANGWVIMRLEGFRYPEDAKAREEAHERALAEAQRRAIRSFHEEAGRKYATVDEPLLKSIDFEAKGEAGVAELLKDQRALAQIQGEPPITVAELTRDCIEKFFHGVAEPIKEHRINPGKQENWERLLGSRLFLKEARVRKLDQDPVHLRRLAGYGRILAFNMVLEKAIIPGVNVTEREAMALYEKRKKSSGSPAMYRLEGIGFKTTAAAQAAAAKVKAGNDLAFMKNNAEGRLKPEEQKLNFDGTLLSTNTLPAALVKALTGAVPGDLRLYDAEGGAQHYLVKVTEYQPPGVRPYEDMREKLGREIEAQKIGAAIKDYAAKLRKVQKVDVIITRIAG
jgi:parvulin-like peptidyl-prolyl isomerase